MDVGLPALAGLLLKVYDDFVDDEPYITNPYLTTLLQTAQVMVYTLVAHNDFWLSFVFSAFNGLAAVASWKEYSRPHVMAYFVLCPFLLLLSVRHYVPLRLFDYPVVYGFLAFGLVEPRLFPEEYSPMKFLSRFGASFITVTAMFIYKDVLSSSMLRLMALSTGYSLASSMAQMLKLAQDTCLLKI
jgi:hypothetical protein